MSRLESVKIILVETFHPGNIGAAARAMKTMGLKELVLVNPLDFPNSEATSRAAGAADLLENAQVVNSLEEAIKDCTQVFATSARRQHSFGRPQTSCESAANWIAEHPEDKVAIVFGPERTGLSADHMRLSQQLLYIPGNPEYDVLNMASAVQITCYELARQLSASPSLAPEKKDSDFQLATSAELKGFYQHLETLLKERGYIRDSQPTDTMKKLSKLFNKAELESNEVSMMRGVIKALTREKIS